MKSRLLRLPAALSLLLAPALLSAAPPARIQAISGATRMELPRSVSGRAQKATDLGEAPPSRRLENVTLHFSPTPAQQSAMTQLLIDQQNPSSPRYHQWLTPAQFGSQFGMSAADLAKVAQWLTSQGLTVAPLAPSSNLISFSGTVAQLEQALGTSIHTITVNGEQHVANLTNPHLPTGLTAVVSGVTGLDDIHLKPRVRQNIVKAASARPNFSSSLSGTEVNFLAPGDIYQVYDINPLLSASTNGAGVTIAVMGETDLSITDVTAFRSAAGLSLNNPTTILVGGTDPGVSSNTLLVAEGQLDVEWSGAVAPSASILYVNSTDAYNISLPAAIDGTVKLSNGLPPPIISISFGLCEQNASGAFFDSANLLFQEANLQGQTIVGPGGDSGATDCDYQSYPAVDGLAVDFPASSPFVTGVGGTEFNEGSGNYWSTTNGTNGASANSYIPEMVWNDSSTNGLSAGGGGLSIYFSKPAWQIGNGVPADFSRDVPDVSFSASPNHDPYLICSSGSCTNGFRDANSFLNTVGGTSVSTPVFAGMLALVEQKINSRIGNANPIIYGLANSTFASTVFHDISVGNNASACVQGSPDCPSSSVPIGYSAAVGYDLATGWGSVDAFNLANTWLQATPAGGATSGVGAAISATTVTSASPTCGISSGSIPLSIQVINDIQGSTITAVPGGSVQILVDNVAVGTAVVLSNGSVSYTLNTASLTSGGHTVSAAYSGDTIYGGSKGTLAIDVVSSTQPDFSITPCNTSVQVLSGGTATGVTYTVNALNGFTGSVAFTVSADASLYASYAFSVSPVVISSGAASGTTVLTLTASQTTGAAKGNTHQLVHTGALGNGIASTRTFYTASSGVAIASLLLLTLPRRRRWGALLAAVISVSMIGALGCGSSSGTLLSGSGTGTGTSPVVTNAVPATYNVTVTGIATTSTGASVIHRAVLQFVVN